MSYKFTGIAVVILVGTFFVFRYLGLHHDRSGSYGENTETGLMSAENNQDRMEVRMPENPRLALEELITAFPDAETTAAERKVFDERVSLLARDSDSVILDSCLAKPMVLRVHLNTDISVRNNDSSDHQITHIPDLSLTVPASSEKRLHMQLPDYGIYGYRCDGEHAGVFLVVQ